MTKLNGETRERHEINPIFVSFAGFAVQLNASKYLLLQALRTDRRESTSAVHSVGWFRHLSEDLRRQGLGGLNQTLSDRTEVSAAMVSNSSPGLMGLEI